jgi:hypothetical protein
VPDSELAAFNMTTARHEHGLGPPRRPATWTEVNPVSKRLRRPVQKSVEDTGSVLAALQRYEEQLSSHYVTLRAEAVDKLSVLFRSLARRGTRIGSVPYSWLRLFERLTILATEPTRTHLRKQAGELVLNMLQCSGSDLDLSPVLPNVVLRLASAAALPDLCCRLESFQLLCRILNTAPSRLRPTLVELLCEQTTFVALVQAWIHLNGGSPDFVQDEEATTRTCVAMQHRSHLQQAESLESSLDALELLISLAHRFGERYTGCRIETTPELPVLLDEFAYMEQRHESSGYLVAKGDASMDEDPDRDVIETKPFQTCALRLEQLSPVAPLVLLFVDQDSMNSSTVQAASTAQLLQNFYSEAFRILVSFVLEDRTCDGRLYDLLCRCVDGSQRLRQHAPSAYDAANPGPSRFSHWAHNIWKHHLEPHWRSKPRDSQADRAFARLSVILADALCCPAMILPELVSAAVEAGAASHLLHMSCHPTLTETAWRTHWRQRCGSAMESLTNGSWVPASSDWSIFERFADYECLLATIKFAYRCILGAHAADNGKREQRLAAECLRQVRLVLCKQNTLMISHDHCKSLMTALAPFIAVPSRNVLVLTELAPVLRQQLEALLERLLVLSAGSVPVRLERALARCQMHRKALETGCWRSVHALSNSMTLETRFLLLIALMRNVSQPEVRRDPIDCIEGVDACRVTDALAPTLREVYTHLRRTWTALSCAGPWLVLAWAKLIRHQVARNRVQESLVRFMEREGAPTSSVAREKDASSNHGAVSSAAGR